MAADPWPLPTIPGRVARSAVEGDRGDHAADPTDLDPEKRLLVVRVRGNDCPQRSCGGLVGRHEQVGVVAHERPQSCTIAGRSRDVAGSEVLSHLDGQPTGVAGGTDHHDARCPGANGIRRRSANQEAMAGFMVAAVTQPATQTAFANIQAGSP